jgi:response regulator RpfG family c-di-GMP phosphodiesterase
MPGMNGVEFLKKVRTKYPKTIRIILSGYADVMAMSRRLTTVRFIDLFKTLE